jgi:hypothetical protein
LPVPCVLFLPASTWVYAAVPALFLSVLLFVALLWCTSILRTTWPRGVQELRHLFPYVVVSSQGHITKSEIETRLRFIVCNQLNVKPHQVLLHSRFREDLGVD